MTPLQSARVNDETATIILIHCACASWGLLIVAGDCGINFAGENIEPQINVGRDREALRRGPVRGEMKAVIWQETRFHPDRRRPRARSA